MNDDTKCPDCKGSGKYVGLLTVEPCRTCGGKGSVLRLRLERSGLSEDVMDRLTWIEPFPRAGSFLDITRPMNGNDFKIPAAIAGTPAPSPPKYLGLP